MNKRKIIIGTFNWEKGSINDNIIRLAKETGYDYQYGHFFDLQLGYDPLYYKTGYRHIEGDTYEVYIEA